jgi:hypothetical protein
VFGFHGSDGNLNKVISLKQICYTILLAIFACAINFTPAYASSLSNISGDAIIKGQTESGTNVNVVVNDTGHLLIQRLWNLNSQDDKVGALQSGNWEVDVNNVRDSDVFVTNDELKVDTDVVLRGTDGSGNEQNVLVNSSGELIIQSKQNGTWTVGRNWTLSSMSDSIATYVQNQDTSVTITNTSIDVTTTQSDEITAYQGEDYNVIVKQAPHGVIFDTSFQLSAGETTAVNFSDTAHVWSITPESGGDVHYSTNPGVTEFNDVIFSRVKFIEDLIPTQSLYIYAEDSVEVHVKGMHRQ